MGKPYMPLMMGDWIRGTRGMKAEVKGVYIGLLIHQYDNGFLPNDMDTLALIEPEVGKVWVSLKDKFEEFEPGKLRNNKLEEVRAFWNKQGKNGGKGGRPKKENPNHNPDTNPNGNPNHNHHNDLDIDSDYDLNKKESVFERVVLPFSSELFTKSWDWWKEYRSELKKPYRSPKSEQAALKRLSKFPEATAILMLEQSIENGWQGIFEVKANNNGNGKFKPNAQANHIDGLIQSRKEAKDRKKNANT